MIVVTVVLCKRCYVLTVTNFGKVRWICLVCKEPFSMFQGHYSVEGLKVKSGSYWFSGRQLNYGHIRESVGGCWRRTFRWTRKNGPKTKG